MLELWALLAFSAVVVAVAGSAIGASWVLGTRRHGRWTDQPYEGGVASNRGGFMRYGAKFYLVSAFFVILDVESAFLYAWAVSAREAGWAGFAELVVFVLLLGAGLLYVWRNGALDFASPMRSARSNTIETTYGPQPPLASVDSPNPASAVRQAGS